MKIVFAVFLTVLTFTSAVAESSETVSMGIRTLKTQVAGVPVAVRVFYPTDEAEVKSSFGPWSLLAAPNSKPSEGQFPLIVVSHGLGGNDWNHHLLARDLVKQGFIVGAVRHPDDLKRVGRQAILVLRPMELSKAIDAILSDPEFSKVTDQDNIGAFGFSQGGLTVLRGLGAQAQHQKLIQHCQEQSTADAEFCTGKSAPLFQKLGILWSKLTYSAPEFDPNHATKDERIKVGVVAAPVGAPVTDLSSVNAPLWIIRPGSDSVLTFPFHSEAIHRSLPQPHRYTVEKNVDHYALLSPFPNSIKDEVGIPAQDPVGFDRTAFLARLNTEITQFFLENLVAE